MGVIIVQANHSFTEYVVNTVDQLELAPQFQLKSQQSH